MLGLYEFKKVSKFLLLIAVVVLLISTADVLSMLLQISEVRGAGGTGLVDVPRGRWLVIEAVRLLGVGDREDDDVINRVVLRVYVTDANLVGTYNITVHVTTGTASSTGYYVSYISTAPTTITVTLASRITQDLNTVVTVYARRV